MRARSARSTVASALVAAAIPGPGRGQPDPAHRGNPLVIGQHPV